MAVRGMGSGRVQRRLASMGSMALALVLIAGCTSDDDNGDDVNGTDVDDETTDDGDEATDADDAAEVDDSDTGADEAAGAADVGPCGEPEDVPEVAAEEYDSPHEMTIDESATYLLTLDTTCGDIVLELDPEMAPIAVNNMVNLAENGYYDGIIFHRVINGFVAQVGDPTGTGTGGPGYSFEDELDHAEDVFDEHGAYPRGTVAMANAGPDTNGSQIFLTQGDPTMLEPHYTIFGAVVDGMDVVDDIVASPTDGMDKPLVDVAIRSVTVETA